MSSKRIVITSGLAIALVCGLLILWQGPANVYGFEKQETSIIRKVDTSKLSGVNLLIARMYNEDRILYAAMVTLVMAVLGTSLAFLTDLVLKALGLEVTRISHRE